MTRKHALIGLGILALFLVVVSRRASCEGCEQRRAKLARFMGVDNAD